MDEQLHHLVGMADLCELLAAAFSFPDDALADALSQGQFESDWRAAWMDATGESFEADSAFAGLADAMCTDMRKEYSRMYLLPGNKVPIWPYENCFIFRAKGREGTPSLFRSPTLIDVENRMRESGVIPVDYRTEPADTMFKEFAFLSYLYGKSAQALDENTRADASFADVEKWHSRVAGFAKEHALAWLPEFMEQTQALSRMDVYRSLACLGASFMVLLSQDVEGGMKAEEQ